MKTFLDGQFYIKNLFAVLIAVSTVDALYAQPAITSFTPTSGPIGTTVTITGTNFSTTAENNIVWFGAVKATVTAATVTQLTVTVPTGATYQPITVTDITTGLTAYSSKPFNVTFPNSGVIDATSFASKVDFNTGSAPYQVAIGDIDGDGKSDLTVANSNSNTVSVYRNTSTLGSIGAGSFATNVDFTTGESPVGVAVGDIDGDGKLDIAVTNYASNTVSVYRNTSTSGSIDASSFTARVDFTTGTGPWGVIIGDIDGDGKPELIVTNDASNTVSVFRNTSASGSITSGSFADRVDFIAESNPRGIAIGDVDGDVKIDLAITNLNGNTVSVFRNTSTSGFITSGSFATKVDFATGGSPYGVTLGDIDGDGKHDLAVTNAGSSTVSVFRNTSTSGSITSSSFTSKVDFTTGTNPVGVFLGDINGDGKPDLAIASTIGNSVSIFRNTSTSGSIGAGSFTASVDFNTGTNPYGVVIGDMDGDSKPDLVIANNSSNTVSVLRNTILPVTLPPTISSFTPTSSPIGTAVTITGTNFNTTAANNIVWFGAVKAAVTTATSTSLSVTVPIGATYQPITVTDITTGLTAYSNAPFTVTFPSLRVIDAAAFAAKVDFTTGTDPRSIAIGDIDGDGKSDLVVTNYGSNSISVYRNTSSSGTITTGSFVTKVDFSTGIIPYIVALGDIDGDGKLDIVVTNWNSNTISVLRNTSSAGSITASSFASKVDFATGVVPHGVALGDLDGDGKSDIVVSNYGSGEISVFRNISTSGSITSSSFSVKFDVTTGSTSDNVALGDIDGDGKPDIAFVNYSNNTVSVIRNTCTSGSIGAGSFAAKVDFTTGTNPDNVVIGDIDTDGKLDIVVTNDGSNTVSVLRNTSTSGVIGITSLAEKVDFSTGTNPSILAIGDIDGDGKPDLAVTNGTSDTFSILRNTSASGSITTGSFATKVDFVTGTIPFGVALGDIDGDGKSDIVVSNRSLNTLMVLRNIIATALPPTISSFTPTSGPIGTAVTITGTNFNTTPENNIVWFGAVKATVTDATSTSLSVTVPTGATYQPITITDVTTGLTAYSSVPFTVTFPSSRVIDATSFGINVAFSVGNNSTNVVISDLDLDGKPDLIVVNSANNTISVLRNTSSSGIIGSGSFASKVDFSTGLTPYNVAIGDLDGDGKPDMVVSNAGSSSVSVFRNTSSLGSITSSSFATKVDIASGSSPHCVVVGDIDGDGKLDLIVQDNNSNQVSVLRNTSSIGSITSGSFATKVDFATGASPENILVGDIDNDGKLDIIATNQVSATMSVLRNTSTMGTIAFDEKVDFVTGTGPYFLSFGDLDGDGKSDLAVVNENSLSILRNTSTSGTINSSSFATKVDFATGTNPRNIAIGDIDGDGKPDIAIGNQGNGSVSVLKNTSVSGVINSGSFATKVDFTSGTWTWGLALGDIEGDGKPEIIITNASDGNTVSVLRNTIAAALPPTISSFTPTSGPIGTTVTITGTNFNTTTANNIVWFGAVKATVTAATSTSLSITVPTGATYQPISVTDITTGLKAYSKAPFTVTFPSSQTISTTSFESKASFTTGTSPSNIAIGDIDGDGKSDMAVTNWEGETVSIYRNISSPGSIAEGSFAPKVDFNVGTYLTGVTMDDLDGDGKLDLVVACVCGTVSVFRNISSSGSFDSNSLATKVDFNIEDSPMGVACGDFDGDGKPDIAVTRYDGYSMSILKNTSSQGSITFAQKVDFTTGTGPFYIVIRDIDGDSKPDIAVTNEGSATVSIFRNVCTKGSITSSSFYTKVDITTGSNPQGISLSDIDGDNKPDLIVGNRTGNTVSVYRNTSSLASITVSSFASKVDFTIGPGTFRDISINDIDGDGKPDIVAVWEGISILKNISTLGSITSGSFDTRVDLLFEWNLSSVNTGDFDGDGKPDIVYINYGNNTVIVLRNNIQCAKPTIRKKGSINILICSTPNATNYQWYLDGNAIASATKQFYVARENYGSYSVQVVESNGCNNRSDAISITTSSAVSVYPNPGDTELNVALDFEQTGEVTIRVVNSLGSVKRIISLKKDMDSQIAPIDIKDLEKGIYFIDVEVNGEKIESQKVVIL